jgi:hypothetical protein
MTPLIIILRQTLTVSAEKTGTFESLKTGFQQAARMF